MYIRTWQLRRNNSFLSPSSHTNINQLHIKSKVKHSKHSHISTSNILTYNTTTKQPTIIKMVHFTLPRFVDSRAGSASSSSSQPKKEKVSAVTEYWNTGNQLFFGSPSPVAPVQDSRAASAASTSSKPKKAKVSAVTEYWSTGNQIWFGSQPAVAQKSTKA
jgi:hypothetical protein